MPTNLIDLRSSIIQYRLPVLATGPRSVSLISLSFSFTSRLAFPSVNLSLPLAPVPFAPPAVSLFRTPFLFYQLEASLAFCSSCTRWILLPSFCSFRFLFVSCSFFLCPVGLRASLEIRQGSLSSPCFPFPSLRIFIYHLFWLFL